MPKRRTVALLATPLLAAAAIATLFAMRHFEDPDPNAAPPAAIDSATGRAQLTTAQGTALQRQLDHLDGILRELEALTDPATVSELQELTEELASTTAVIQDAAPGSLHESLAESYYQVTVASIELLDRIEVAADAGGALLSARNIAQFGRDIVTQYLIDTQLEVTRESEPPEFTTRDSA